MKKLVYGIGFNDADYFVKKIETIGYVDGKKEKKRYGSALSIELGNICLNDATPPNSKSVSQHTKAALSQRVGTLSAILKTG